MEENREPRRIPTLGEGIRTGIGVLSAFKEAIEETIQEASERGDLSPERAKEFLGDALHRAQDAAGEVRERLDLVPRREFDALRAEVEALRRRLDALEGRSPAALPASTGTPALAAPEGPTEARMP
jgi:polyhydroxyalkanoate synthesis regulator phasin